jgi:hypothetical protein
LVSLAAKRRWPPGEAFHTTQAPAEWLVGHADTECISPRPHHELLVLTSLLHRMTEPFLRVQRRDPNCARLTEPAPKTAIPTAAE